VAEPAAKRELRSASEVAPLHPTDAVDRLATIEQPSEVSQLLNTTDPRKIRGAYFTPPTIADYLAHWAIAGRPDARVLDPTCGDGAFLIAAGRTLTDINLGLVDLDSQLFGVDLHEPSLLRCSRSLESEGLTAKLLKRDFFSIHSPNDSLVPEPNLPLFDAVIGNPPFVRYHHHTGKTRQHSVEAAQRQGVQLSGLASSWAALLIHASSFLRPNGRLAMVLPGELLTVGYAEPVRKWLRTRFAKVGLVLFEKLQFKDALEDVVLLLASGRGETDGFTLHHASSADELQSILPLDHYVVSPQDDGKWTPILLSRTQRRIYRAVVERHFTPLSRYGTIELGTVTGANDFFCIDEATRQLFGLRVGDHVVPICPPGTRHLADFAFTQEQWEDRKSAGDRVWLLCPTNDKIDDIRRYLEVGVKKGINLAYKCTIREPWWRPPMAPIPDLFFTYMSHRFPRLIGNTSRVGFLNSMHGIRLVGEERHPARLALPVLAINSVTMLGAELQGRSYGGGILKMEPSEARSLPVPNLNQMLEAWKILEPDYRSLNHTMADGDWETVLDRVDHALLTTVLGQSAEETRLIRSAGLSLRQRRLRRDRPS